MSTRSSHLNDVESIHNAREAKDFEAAIAAAGFGLFNICLLLVTFPGIIATLFGTSSMSYILPSAECDLSLSVAEKGVLNAVTFAGMIITAVPWGYIADTMGRKNVLVYGFLIDGLLILAAALSQNFVQLALFKFLSGLVVSGPFAVIITYISEFHGKQHRARVILMIGMIKTLATLLLPALAWAILTQHWKLDLFGFKIHAWQIFIATTAVPNLISGSLIAFFPESPKFQMTQAKNEKALATFQKIFALNTGNIKDVFSIISLIEEAPPDINTKLRKRVSNKNLFITKTLEEKFKNVKASFTDGLKQLRPMFSKPYLGFSVIVYSMMLCILMGHNALRLWLPQLFATMSEFESQGLGIPSMCAILEYNINKTGKAYVERVNAGCLVVIEPGSYTSNMIVSATSIMGFIIAALLANTIGNNNILTICTFMASACGYALYWSTSALTTLVIASVFVTAGSIAFSCIMTVSINMFPTTIRSMVVVMVLTFGRLGSLLGSIAFPLLTTIDCVAPFLMIGSVFLIAFILSWFLPEASKVDLK